MNLRGGYVGCLFLLVLGLLFAPAIAAQIPGQLDLNGTWTTDKAEEIEITHLPSGLVNSIFTNPVGGQCPDPWTSEFRRTQYIDGKIANNQIKQGKMWFCNSSEDLVTKPCKDEPVFSVPFDATNITNDMISGKYVSQYYKVVDRTPSQDTDKDVCKYVRDPSGDTMESFVLTRKDARKCLDKEKIEAFNKAADATAEYAETVSRHIEDNSSAKMLEHLAKALRALSRYVKLAEKCDEIHDSLKELMEFKDAIDQVNNAGCDNHSLAAGFDNLFRSGGKLGKRFVKVPELQPVFEIMSQDYDFFIKNSGNLDPEQRWAGQLRQVDSWVPNCSR